MNQVAEDRLKVINEMLNKARETPGSDDPRYRLLLESVQALPMRCENWRKGFRSATHY
jgi:hypothetical protein